VRDSSGETGQVRSSFANPNGPPRRRPGDSSPPQQPVSNARVATLGALETVELEIRSLAAGGEGVARAPDGRVVFVRGAAPGDVVRARVVALHKRFARAEIEEIVRAGAVRVEPACAVHGACGGCGWQHVAYEAQLAAKREILTDALRRLAGLTVLPEPLDVVPSPTPYATRSRARLLFRKGRVGYRRGHSHELCATDRCPVLAPALEDALGAIAAHPPAGGGELTLALGDDGVVSVAGASVRGASARPVAIETAAGEMRVSPRGFFQAHQTLRSALAREVLTQAGRAPAGVELHAGAGFFTLPLSEQMGELIAVEGDPRAAVDLRENLARAVRKNVRVLEQPLGRALAGGELARLAPRVIVLDPPRSGLGESDAAALAGLRARRLVYVSCDPATLARDLRVLGAGGGYALTACRGFDMFPQTPHLEVVAVLEQA
jgi:23S rRNA (uracil1939-C5)-methyltransferase